MFIQIPKADVGVWLQRSCASPELHVLKFVLGETDVRREVLRPRTMGWVPGWQDPHMQPHKSQSRER